MNKTKLFAIITVLILILALVSCGGKKLPAETIDTDAPNAPELTQTLAATEQPEPVYAKTAFTNWKEYSIIYEDGAASVVSSAFVNFNLKLSGKYNFTPRTEFLFPVKVLLWEHLKYLSDLQTDPKALRHTRGLRQTTILSV